MPSGAPQFTAETRKATCTDDARICSHHAVDATRYLLGDPPPETVYARIGTHNRDYDVDDTGTIIIGWDNGAYSYIESGWWQPHSDGPEAAG
jgi:predicted dehydrogenase